MSSESSKDRGYDQFTQSSKRRRFIPFAKRMSILRFQNAVVECGQKLLHLTLRTLILGDINSISSCVREIINNDELYNKLFTDEERQVLERNEHTTWDITMLFKVIQKTCGLQPAGDKSWTKHSGDDEPLEHIITNLKNLRNNLVHNFTDVIDEDQLANRLVELKDLAENMITALGKRAKILDKQLLESESAEVLNIVQEIIADSKGEINNRTSAPSSPPMVDSTLKSPPKVDSASTSQSRVLLDSTTPARAIPSPSSSKSVPASTTSPRPVPKSVEDENDSDGEGVVPSSSSASSVPASTTSTSAVPESVDLDEEDSYEADNLQYDSVSNVPGSNEHASEDPLLMKEIEDLEQKFWKFAGPKKITV